MEERTKQEELVSYVGGTLLQTGVRYAAGSWQDSAKTVQCYDRHHACLQILLESIKETSIHLLRLGTTHDGSLGDSSRLQR